jgi:Glutaminase
MSVAKPFVFALVCEMLGAEEVRQKLGVNATGLPFDSLASVERSPDGRSNPMVNAGAIAATSLVPGDSAAAKWLFLRDGQERDRRRDHRRLTRQGAAWAPSPRCWTRPGTACGASWLARHLSRALGLSLFASQAQATVAP